MNNQGTSFLEDDIRQATHLPEPSPEFANSLWTQIVELDHQKSIYLPKPRPPFLTNLKLTFDWQVSPSRRLQTGVVFILALLLAGILIFTTPGGRAFAQSVLSFFTRAKSDTLPTQTWQMSTPNATEAGTSDPSSILDANLTIEEAEHLAGFDILKPTYTPQFLSFSGASYESDHRIVRIFYRYVQSNGLVIREEPYVNTEDCELCGEVGASADVETVQIGDTTGEYVEGVWKLTDNGPVWESDPYLKTLRWQANSMAFELIYMGPPDTLTKEDLIKVARNLK